MRSQATGFVSDMDHRFSHDFVHPFVNVQAVLLTPGDRDYIQQQQPLEKNQLQRDELWHATTPHSTPAAASTHPKSLYALLLRLVKWRREHSWSEITLKTQTHQSYRFICWTPGTGRTGAADEI